jgi:hypothetical protein
MMTAEKSGPIPPSVEKPLLRGIRNQTVQEIARVKRKKAVS